MLYHYRSGNHLYLAKEFPQIEDITGTIKINLSSGGPNVDVSPFTLADLPTNFVECESAVCKDGGISQVDLLRELLTRMVRDSKIDDSLSEWCPGYQEMGEKQTRRCNVLSISITAHLTYKETAKAE
jgi:hypothetical protein